MKVSPVAVFDFDRTIASEDTFFNFILFLFKGRQIRHVLSVTVISLLFPLLIIRQTREIGLSIPLWIATFGIPKRRIVALLKEFEKYYFRSSIQGTIYEKSLEQINYHQAQGHDVVIITGTSRILVQTLLKGKVAGKYAIVCSKFGWILGGLVLVRHCYGKNKLLLARRQGLELSGWEYGYSDSKTDIPVLLNCKNRYLINPSSKFVKKAKRKLKTNYWIRFW